MKYDRLRAQWSKRERDILYIYPRKCDGAFLHWIFSVKHFGYDGKQWEKTVLEELNERGYDVTTLKFSIARKSETTR